MGRINKYNLFVNEGKESKLNIKKYDIDGFVVYQGKDASSNDYLTFEMSDPDDIWMHASKVPGSHVLIKVGDKTPTKDVIEKVAEIAAKNSKSKENKVTVVYCKKRFVRKSKEMNDGQVSVDYKNSNEIVVNRK
jgi:predicted ribosome quality control (RQC) complex YloA/Tae2 family protein